MCSTRRKLQPTGSGTNWVTTLLDRNQPIKCCQLSQHHITPWWSRASEWPRLPRVSRPRLSDGATSSFTINLRTKNGQLKVFLAIFDCSTWVWHAKSRLDWFGKNTKSLTDVIGKFQPTQQCLARPTELNWQGYRRQSGLHQNAATPEELFHNDPKDSCDGLYVKFTPFGAMSQTPGVTLDKNVVSPDVQLSLEGT